MKSNIPVIDEEEDESSESSSEEAVESDRESSDKPVANTHREDTEMNENEGGDADSTPEEGENDASKPGEVGTSCSSSSAFQSVGQDAPRIHVQTGGKCPRKTSVVTTIPDEEDEEEELDGEDDDADDSDHLDDLGGVKREREESLEDATESPAGKRLRIEE
jgi:hypothetical protein